jgi:hypothetical protein
MNQERESRLEKIGFEFNGKEKWNLQFNKLRDYYVKHGHCELFWAVDRFTFIFNSPTNIPPVFSLNVAGRVSVKKEEPKLCSWANNQRTRFKNGRMDQGQKKRLDEISFDFAPGKGKIMVLGRNRSVL